MASPGSGMSAAVAGLPKGSDRPRDAGTGSVEGDDMASCQVMGPAATKLEIAARMEPPVWGDERSHQPAVGP
jgi:hypothetical protein